MQHITVKTRVAYSRQFLRSTGMLTGDAPFARGIVTEVVNDRYARVDWVDKTGRCTSKSTALLSNLVREDRLHLERS